MGLINKIASSKKCFTVTHCQLNAGGVLTVQYNTSTGKIQQTPYERFVTQFDPTMAVDGVTVLKAPTYKPVNDVDKEINTPADLIGYEFNITSGLGGEFTAFA